MTKETKNLPQRLAVSSEPAQALALYDLLKKRRALIEVRRFSCASDPDFASFHGRIVITTKCAAALEAILVGACELGGGAFLAHSIEEVEIAGTEDGLFSRDEIARIAAGDRRAAA